MAHSSRCQGYHGCQYELIDLDDSLSDDWDISGIISDLRHQYTHVSTHYLQSPTLCRAHGSRETSRVRDRGGVTFPSSRCSSADTSCRRSTTTRTRSPSLSTTVDASDHISRGRSTAIKESKLKRPTVQRSVEARERAVKMDSPVIKAVLDMGIPEALIRETLLARLAENGEEFTSSESLVEAIFSSEVTNNAHKADTDSVKPVGEDSLKLMEENRLLKEQKQCKICMDDDVCVVFVPCGHLVCCDTCAPTIKVCPICRAKIKKTVRAYLS